MEEKKQVLELKQEKNKMSQEWKSILYALPATIFISLDINASVFLNTGHSASIHVWLIVLLLIACPIYLGLTSKSKHKNWIVWLAALCFLPFGTIFYIVSFIWALADRFIGVRKKDKDSTKAITKTRQLSNKPKENNKNILTVKNHFKKYVKIYALVAVLFALGSGIVFFIKRNDTSAADCERARMLAKSINYTMQKIQENKNEEAQIGMCGIWGIYKFSDKEIMKISKNHELYEFFIKYKIEKCQLIKRNPEYKNFDDILVVSKLAMKFVEEHAKCLVDN